MLVKFRISSSLKKLSKKILPLGFILCLANSSVLTPTTPSVENNSPKKFLLDNFKISEQLSQRMQLLSAKYDENTVYEDLSDLEKQELFDVQNELFTNLGYNPFKKLSYEKAIYIDPVTGLYYYDQDPSYFIELWGANLWLNLTVFETEWWIQRIKKYLPTEKYGRITFDQLYQIADTIARELQYNPKITFIFEMIYAFAVAGRFSADYFNWKYLSNLSSLGSGKISYRFTFGFIPSGVHPGYN